MDTQKQGVFLAFVRYNQSYKRLRAAIAFSILTHIDTLRYLSAPGLKCTAKVLARCVHTCFRQHLHPQAGYRAVNQIKRLR